MKILAIGRNYSEHIRELGNEIPEEPVVFIKPDSALLRNNSDFYYPDFSREIHQEVEIVLKIAVAGKNIQEKFAHKYYDEIGLGVDFTARDVQNRLKAKGLPWEIAKGFNGSAPVSEFLPKSQFNDLDNIPFGIKINGEWKQQGNTSQMIYRFDYIVSYLSRFFLLKKGDLIFTGTPKGVGPVQVDDHLEGYIGDKKMLDFKVK